MHLNWEIGTTHTRRIRCLVCLLAVLQVWAVLQAVAQERPTIYDRPVSDRRVAYEIEADLDVEARTVKGIERVRWRNPDSVPVNELQFHLYLNAFSGPRTTFMRESRGQHRGFESPGADTWGRVDVTDLRIVDSAFDPDNPTDVPPGSHGPIGADLTEAIEYIRPDDGNVDDFTVMRVALPEPVQPGESIVLRIEFVSKLPEVFARTGWKRKEDGSMFFFVGQWFPKLGVYEVPGQRYVPEHAERGAWNTHQFHANSEFYADFGTYRVSMTVPEGYVVGATGIRLSETTSGGRKTIVHEAVDVHDFAWTTSPAFIEFNDVWEHVAIRLLIQPEHKGQARRHIESAKVALQYFADWYGEYPYTSLTLVDGLGGSNGMEYPTLFTCGTTYALPEWIRVPEMIIIHEFGHQYWYGIVASNEFEEAWLDEGINSYTEMKIMDEAYGPGSLLDVPGWQINGSDVQRILYTKNRPTRDRIYLNSWEYMTGGSYNVNSYAKPATVLWTLENYLGTETMRSILRTYYDRWRFRHPTTKDFLAIANEVSGQDLSWFFDQFIYGSVAIDYRVDGVWNDPLDSDSASSGYDSMILLTRAEEGVYPVDVLVRYEDGRSETIRWDGRDKWRRLNFRGTARVVEVFIDPDNRVPLDIDRSNNREIEDVTSGAASKYGLKFIVWLQQILQLFAALI